MPSQREFAELFAELFDADIPAQNIVSKAGGKHQKLRPFGAMAIETWWEHVYEEVDKGIFENADPCSFVSAALCKYPGNKILQQLNSDCKLAGGRKSIDDIKASCFQDSTKKSIFLSYSRHNRSDVDQLYSALVSAYPDIQVFQDHRMPPGVRWYDLIRAAAGNATAMVCWVTQPYLASTFCSFEIGLAEQGGATIIPVSLLPTGGAGSLPAYLGQRQMIKPTDPRDYKEISGKIITGIP